MQQVGSATKHVQHAQDVRRIRGWLLLILALEIAGVGAELLLIGHVADPWQWLPIILMAAALLVIAWAAFDQRAAVVRALQVLMALFIVSGFIGTFQHYSAKRAFQLEVNPPLQGVALFWEALKSVSPPALAPGVMIQMGLLGFAYAYRHPALRKRDDE
jgi:hypothetical protein